MRSRKGLLIFGEQTVQAALLDGASPCSEPVASVSAMVVELVYKPEHMHGASHAEARC